MKPQNTSKKNAAFSYGIGVAQIVAGIPVAVISLIIVTVVGAVLHRASGIYYTVAFILMSIAFVGVWLVLRGMNTCRLIGNYRKLSTAMQYKNREKIAVLAAVTGQKLTGLVRDLRTMADKGYFPGAYLDINSCEFVLERDNRPLPALNDGDVVLREKVRPSLTPLLSFPVVFIAYVIIRPFSTWHDFAAAGVISLTACVVVAVNTKKVHIIVEKKYKALPPPEPVAINTGNTALDELLTAAMGYVNRLNELSLLITNEKMILPVGELLNISRQIFAFVEKQPEKIRQIRQFMNYYLPTTIKLLTSYSDFSNQPLKGESIKEAMTKIEDSMDGIVETFRRELDNLYRDKSEDIAVDIDVMLAMLRQQGISDDFAGQR